MEADSPDHEDRIRKLEQKVPNLDCEIRLLHQHIDTCVAQVRAELVSAIAASEERMRAYIDARIAPLEKGQRWIIGLLISLLLGVIGGMASVIGILTRILEKLA